MTKRLRCVAVTLVPQFVVDDGDTLTPIQVEPIALTMDHWPNVVERFAAATAELQASLFPPESTE